MKKRVLVVDDAVFMRMKLKDILVSNGYEVVGEADNGKDAIEVYKSERPDIVTMDITMPDMDGIDALKGIKKIDEDATIIICSAMGQQGMVMEAIEEGAADFIVKPFEEDRVIKSLNKLSS